MPTCRIFEEEEFVILIKRSLLVIDKRDSTTKNRTEFTVQHNGKTAINHCSLLFQFQLS